MGLNELIDYLEKAATIAAIIIGGMWVYFNSISGRVFIPRLQVSLSGRLVLRGETQFVLVDMQVKNVGSRIAEIKEKGSGLKISSLSGSGGVAEALELTVQATTAFSVLNLKEGETRKIEPGTAISAQDIIEVPKEKYDAFQLELQIFALSGSAFHPNRKWRAIAIATNELTAKPT